MASAVQDPVRLYKEAFQVLEETNVSGHPPSQTRTSVAVEANALLDLAFVVMNTSPDEYRGYAVTSDRDAFFIARRRGDLHEVLMTCGDDGQWKERWSYEPTRNIWERQEIPPQPMSRAELERLMPIAAEFADHWLWFQGGPDDEIELERQRFLHMGYPIGKANIRLGRLSALPRKGTGGWELDTLPADATWIGLFLRRHWAVA